MNDENRCIDCGCEIPLNRVEVIQDLGDPFRCIWCQKKFEGVGVDIKKHDFRAGWAGGHKEKHDLHDPRVLYVSDQVVVIGVTTKTEYVSLMTDSNLAEEGKIQVESSGGREAACFWNIPFENPVPHVSVSKHRMMIFIVPDTF